MAGKNRVIVETHFAEWGAHVESLIAAKLDEVMPQVVEAAKTAEVRRASGALADSIHTVPVIPTPFGFEGGIGASDFKANWYELGTLARRSKGKTSRGRSDKASGASTGVKGLHFMRKGLYACRAQLYDAIARAMQEARGL
jgi:hypothetical protein